MKKTTMTVVDLAREGGKARSRAMTSEEKSEQARDAARARWAGHIPKQKQRASDGLPRATHGDESSPLRIGGSEIDCYVLEDGRRVLAQVGMMRVLGLAKSGAHTRGVHRLHGLATGKRILPFASAHLQECTRSPIRFVTTGGRNALGFEATILADLCFAILEARREEALQPNQFDLAKQAEILVQSFAKVGIIALVDEATGYQYDRARDALASILETFIAKELAGWVKTFQNDFYRELFRLKNWQYSDLSSKRPAYVGKITSEIVYERLAPGILEELRRKNPRSSSGRRKSTHHQWLTRDVGHPRLREHLAVVTAMMKISPDYTVFQRHLDRVCPRYEHNFEFPFEETDSNCQ